MLYREMVNRMNIEIIIYGIFFIVPSVLFLIFPIPFLKLGSKLKYKDAEPSDTAIIIGRVASIFGIIIGLALIVLGIVWGSI